MHAFSFNVLFTLFTLFTAFVSAAPIACPDPEPASSQVEKSSSSSKSTGHTDAGTFLAPSPRWVTYTDAYVSENVVPKASQLNGYNVFILAFYLSSGPSDQLQAFTSLSSSKRKAIINDLHSNGISLMMSVFGSTEAPTTDGVNPWSFASEVASFVKKYNLDGVDVDYEDFKAINNGSGEAEQWLINFSNALRSHLPSGQYFITHAPVAPWFTTDKGQYPHGAYRAVAQKTGDVVDWYNIQYYNQDNLYSSCSHVIDSSPSGFPNTAVKQIHQKSGIPLDKLVIGKPARSSDANNNQDFMSRGEIASCLQQAKDEFGWNAGAMFWEWHDDMSADLISTVRGLSFPILGNL